MTKKQKHGIRGFFLSAERCTGGMRFTLGPVVSVAELSHERILLSSHGARVEILGERLDLGVFEERAVEVVGRVREVRFDYGKN